MTPKIRPIGAPAPTRSRLNSWKEIAAYLNRDPRTVQLWEKHEGLPIRRITHLSRASVYAFTAEIDAWMRSRSGPAESAISVVPHNPSRQPRFALPRRRATYLALLTGFVLALLLAAAFWAWHSRRALPTAQLPMLVVLPFENQTSSDEFLVDALTEDLTQNLSRAGAFQVISWRSASSLRGRRLSLHQLAAEFHASFVIQGTVAQVGDQATVTVELLDTVHEARLWGASYTRRSADMLSSQYDVAATITTAISKQITGAPPLRSAIPIEPRGSTPAI
ncbi:MAG TPA: hypothetical protein VG225_14675 [Terracidiphilus sp.]|nr:hypothetical protein [Terracidiphilus sp.]